MVIKKELTNFKVLLEAGSSDNYIVTIAIGDKYYHDWEKYALPTWLNYCKNHNLGIIVFINDLIDVNNKLWKKATWQKLLIGSTLEKSLININNVCYLDTDILINHCAPNVFENYDEETLGLVSIKSGLPQQKEDILRRMAFLRHKYYDNTYPLDSALFMTDRDLYIYHGLEPKNDFFCAGFFIFNLLNHSNIMKEWFNKYPSDVSSITNNGDQTHLNYEFLNWGKVSWLDYKFQAIWTYEMSWKYPFLYKYRDKDNKLIRECVEASLFTNYFLHFAGSWYESDMWKNESIYNGKTLEFFNEYNKYSKTPVSGDPKGVIRPRH